jgi:hypothetical protein
VLNLWPLGRTDSGKESGEGFGRRTVLPKVRLISRKGLLSSQWDCLCVTENMDIMKRKKEMYTSFNLNERAVGFK